MIQLSDKSTDSKIDTTERDRLAKEDPERLRLQLLLGKERAEQLIEDKKKKEAEEKRRWAAMSREDKVLSLVAGRVSDDIYNQIEKILKA